MDKWWQKPEMMITLMILAVLFTVMGGTAAMRLAGFAIADPVMLLKAMTILVGMHVVATLACAGKLTSEVAASLLGAIIGYVLGSGAPK